jgi:hypothetical protein
MRREPSHDLLKHSFPWGGIMLALASLMVTLIILKIVFRTTHLFGARISVSTPDTLLGWRFVAASPCWEMKENDHPITGTINSWVGGIVVERRSSTGIHRTRGLHP